MARSKLASFFALAVMLAAPKAHAQDFLSAYQAFLNNSYNSRSEGIQKVDTFLAKHYTQNAVIRYTHETTWALPNAQPRQFSGTGKASPMNWKTQLGPQYNGEPLAFPAYGHIEKAEITSTGQTATSLKTKEAITAFYQLVPGMGGFRAQIESRCDYTLRQEKVSAQACNATIRVTPANPAP